MTKSTGKNTPIYIFDEHNEAFYYWHKAKNTGLINRPLDLFHIDAHHDMDRAEAFKKTLYFSNSTSQEDYLNYFKNFAKNELKISNFIIPAVLNGLVKNVYFVYPDWRNFKPRRKKMSVCSAFGEGKILKHGIKIKKNTDPIVLKVYPDLTFFNYSAQEIDGIPKNRKVILDIDMDYFACIDSVSNHIHYELEITESQFRKKEKFLNNKSLLFAGLDFCFIERDEKYYVQVAYKKVKEASYIPTKEEIESEMDTMLNTLKIKKARPAVITICRSCISGYCPNQYHEFIEKKLKQKLKMFLNQ